MSFTRLVAIRDVAALLAKAHASASVRGFASAACVPSSKQTSQRNTIDWRRWSAASAATFGFVCWLYESTTSTHCLDGPTDLQMGATEPSAARLQQWLTDIDASVDAVEIRRSKDHPEAGLGVFASDGIWKPLHVSWWKRSWYSWQKPNDGIILASFPLQAAVTPQTILTDPVLGSMYQELLSIGVLDERSLMLLFLTVERQQGEDSVWHPWISMLPRELHTPLFYSDDKMAELRGTSIEEAVRVQKWQLAQAWKRLEPACIDLLRKAGSQHKQPSFQDFMWAYAIFHSRSLSFPEPKGVEGQVTSIPQEGIIPGLDFCNHREWSSAKWTIFGTPGLKLDGNGMPALVPTEMALVCPRQQAPKPGQEITISYGDKSNEQLLMAYGFTEPNNLNDVLMIKCPVAPPEDRDQLLQARLELLKSRGLTPQLFLPASLLEVRPTRSSTDRYSWLTQARRNAHQLFASLSSSAEAAGTRTLRLPEEVEQTLKILVMMPKQLASELVSEEQPGPAENTLDTVEQSGERMAVLTTLVGLLELKHLQMEGEDGTGSLESDIQLMEANDAEVCGDSLSEAKKACLIYRSSQKRIAREYLIRARQELLNELSRLRHLQEKE